jgi:cytochrome c553
MVAAPILFAQHEAYLVKQLNDFKANVRKNDSTRSMNIVAKNLDTQSIQAVAFYLAHRQQNDEKK